MNNAALFAEYIGTFLLTLVIQTNTIYYEGTQTNSVFVILAVFFIAITITREISGGHINPAVTLALYLKDLNNSNNSFYDFNSAYIVVQCLGALSAALLGIIINNNIFKLALNPDNSNAFTGFIMEMLGSAFFYLVILIQSDNQRNNLYTNKTLSTLIITAGLGCGIAIAGNISGAGLNPAVAIGFNIGRLLITGDLSELKYLLLYIIAPCLGSYLANWLYYNAYDKYYIITSNKPIKAYDNNLVQKASNSKKLIELKEFK